MSKYESEPLTFAAALSDGTYVVGALPGGEFDPAELDEPAARWVAEIGISQGLVRPAAPRPAVAKKEA